MQTLNVGSDKRMIAFEQIAGSGPGIIWLGGFMSDMTGSKAECLAQYARETGRAFLRFDYSGHGVSGGAFTDGTISRWLEEAEAMLALTDGPQIIVGSSMGGWIAQLLALRAPNKVHGLVLIAPATDMTHDLMWEEFGPSERNKLMEEGVYYQPSDYGKPYPITRALIEDGRSHLLFPGPIGIQKPVHILQGRLDPDVPYTHALKLLDALPEANIAFTLIKDGDHRLSTPENLELLKHTVAGMAEA